MTRVPDIQIVIPVHDPSRPVRRAVESVIAEPRAQAIVVAHNVEPAALDLPSEGPQMRIVRCDRSPGMPGAAFDAGIAQADARWLGIMGSDDWFEPMALQTMMSRADTDKAEGVIAPLAYQGGSRGFSPRTLRHRNLQAVRDRLFYRTAPLGLFRREILQDPEYRFGDEYPVGEDLRVSVKLWTKGLSVSHYGGDPAYVVGSDATGRITATSRRLPSSGGAWQALWADPWVVALDARTRHALAVKVARVHVLGAIVQRPRPEDWEVGDFEWLSSFARQLRQEAPRFEAPFRRATQRTLAALLEGSLEDTLRLSALEDSAGLRDKLLPATSSGALTERDSTLRWQMVGLAHRIKQIGANTLPSPSSNPKPRRGRETRRHKPKLLILSFSPIERDARVLKQVALFADRYDVTTCGFGDPPKGSDRHLRLREDLDPARIDGRLITLRQYWLAYWTTAAVRLARRQLEGQRFDLVLANDVEAVPLALSLKPTIGVHADLHEYYPSLHEYDEAWKRRISPYMSWLCRRYVARTASQTTVSSGLQRAYLENFGFLPELVPNATPFADLVPTPVHRPLRLVHSGGCQRNRRLDVTLEAVRRSAADLTLDLYLTPNDPAHLVELQKEFADEPRIRFNSPVPYADLCRTLNDYDVGVHVLAPTSFNNRYALPNKFFDYVQARLGIIVGPSPEMAQLTKEWGFGAVCDGFEAEDLTRVLDLIAPDAVAEWKRAADGAAPELAADRQSQGWAAALDRLQRAEGVVNAGY